jgi:pimeloyl-ACP methyl ester carboxylesterase
LTDLAENSESRDWVTKALADKGTRGSLVVDRARINYRVWREGLEDVVILVHGGATNSHVWDHLAPMLPADRSVVALDLSGHGDSDARSAYSTETWAAEVLALAHHLGSPRHTVLIGHSMGGKVVFHAERQETFGGLIVVDSTFRPNDHPRMEERRVRAGKKSRVHPSAESAVEAFAARTKFGPMLSSIKQHLALTSIKKVDSGWTWKFDPRIYTSANILIDTLTPLRCPGLFIRAETGNINDALLADMMVRLRGTMPSIDMPASGHHVMFNQPLALLGAMAAALRIWQSADSLQRPSSAISK